MLAALLATLLAACGDGDGDDAGGVPSAGLVEASASPQPSDAAPAGTTLAASTGGRTAGLSFAVSLKRALAASAPYDDYRAVTDGSGALIINVPAAWSDVDGSAWFDDEPFAPSITAAIDIDGFYDRWTEPGMFFGVSEELAELIDVNAMLEQVRDDFDLDTACDYIGRFNLSHPLYSGRYDQYSNCGGQRVVFVSLVAQPADGSYLLSLMAQLVTERDAEALDRMLASFAVTTR